MSLAEALAALEPREEDDEEVLARDALSICSR